MQIICVECGKPFDDSDLCRVCLNRNERLKRAFYVCFYVDLVAFTVTAFILGQYPPIGSCWWVAYTMAGLVVIPAAIVFVLDNYDRLTRYATSVVIMAVVVAGASASLPAYLSLNVILDPDAAAQVPAQVSGKFINHNRRYGDSFVIRTSFSWKEARFEDDDLHVNEETYLAIQPGDTVRVLVHPGRFSLPWYSAVLPSSSRGSDSR